MRRVVALVASGVGLLVVGAIARPALAAQIAGPAATPSITATPPPAPIGRSTIEAVEVDVDVELTSEQLIYYHAQTQLDRDFEAMQMFRPGYSFWQHIYAIPDGSVAFGSAEDGRLLAVFPTRGDWERGARWTDDSLASAFSGANLPRALAQRRDQVQLMLEPVVGRVVHNETRGEFLRPKAELYGSFLREWGRIYERFGVPAQIGLAQAVVESGLDGRIRSEANAIGFCQWLEGNWNRMKRLSPTVIEGYNQTTQAPYCAAYLRVLATKYGTFIPALSEHHAGGTNVGRTVIYGEWLGGNNTRERYLMGSEFVLDLRQISMPRFRDVVRTYGPRSFRYSELVFGNTITVGQLLAQVEQVDIHAMRATRAISLDEVTRATGLSRREVQRFNPALVRQVPRGANLYLPIHVEAFGPDVAFWHHPPPEAFARVLNDFVRLDHPPAQWDDRSFEPVLADFRERFRATGTEEGNVMATVLGYYMDEAYRSRRSDILADVRTDGRIRELFFAGLEARLSGAGL